MPNVVVQPEPTPEWEENLPSAERKGLASSPKGMVSAAPGVVTPRTSEVGDPNAVQDQYVPMPVSCVYCEYKGQISVPSNYTGPETWECPKCGNRFKVVVTDE